MSSPTRWASRPRWRVGCRRSARPCASSSGWYCSTSTRTPRSAQAELLRALFSGPTPPSGRGHPVTAVGDPCQAIYGWRGAAAANIITFAEQFPNTDGSPATPYALTVNRRSGQQILDAANALSGPLRADEELQWDGIDTDLVAPKGTPPGDIRVATFDTWPGEVAWVADDIAAAHDSGRARRWSDIAVLARRNAHIRPLYAELLERGIPVEIVGLDGLLAVPEVADVVAVLRVLGDATANPDLVRVLTGPRWAIGPADLATLGRRARELAGVPRPIEEADARRGDRPHHRHHRGRARAQPRRGARRPRRGPLHRRGAPPGWRPAPPSSPPCAPTRAGRSPTWSAAW